MAQSYHLLPLAKGAAKKPKSGLSNLESSQCPTLLERVGWRAASALIAATLAVLAAVGFICFLWFAKVDNSVWHRIIIEGWLTRSITISTLILRFATDIQAGIAAAMLAALILESSSITLHRVGQVSIMRATNPQPRALLEFLPAMMNSNGTSHRFHSILYSLAAVVLVITTTTLQFSSTILLSDLSLGQLPSAPNAQTVLYDFNYTSSRGDFFKYGGGVGEPFSFITSLPIQPKTATWSRSPPSFPTFAEYSEPSPSMDGVDDTGILLRAFLPFTDAQTRENLRNYSGNAMLLDSRVSCQRPKLYNVSLEELHTQTDNPAVHTAQGFGRITGEFSPSAQGVERLWTPNSLVPFSCNLLVRDKAFMSCQATNDFEYGNGGLLSEFWNITDVPSALENGIWLWQLPQLVFRAQNMSSVLIDTKVLRIEDDGIWANIITNTQTWSVSICYSSWMTADLDINMYSHSNRSEPVAFWNLDRGYYTEPDVLSQLGIREDSGTSPESRGILQLTRKTSWIPDWKLVVPNTIQPFVQQFADILGGDGVLSVSCVECSALLPPPLRGDLYIAGTFSGNGPKPPKAASSYSMDYIDPLQTVPNAMLSVDNALSSIFHNAFETSGSLARAMSTLITLQSSMAYYDQMPAFDQKTETTQISFVTVLLPQSYLGLASIGITLAAHVGLICCIIFAFAFRSRHTLLGNYWQTVAQIIGPETKDILVASRVASDKEVKKELRATGNDIARVGIRSLKDRRMVGLSIVEPGTVAPVRGKVILPPITLANSP